MVKTVLGLDRPVCDGSMTMKVRHTAAPTRLCQPTRTHQLVEAGSDARLGADQPRLSRIGLDLGPHLPDKDAQVVHVLDMGRPPHTLQQLAMRQHQPGMARHMREQVVFLGRQVHLLAVVEHLPPG